MAESSLRQVSSVHGQYGPRHERGFVRGEEQYGVGHLGRLAEPAHGVRLPHGGDVFFGQLDYGLGGDRSWRHGVYANTVCGPLDRKVLGDAGSDELGGSIRGLPRLPGEGRDRKEADYGTTRRVLP